MNDTFKKVVKKQLALVQAGKPPMRFLFGLADPDPVLVLSPRKVELSAFTSLAKTAYVQTFDVPDTIASGLVSVDDGTLTFQVGPVKKGNISLQNLKAALRKLGNDATAPALSRCEVVERDDDGPEENDGQLADAKRLLCQGDGAKLGELALAFGGVPALVKALDAIGGADVIAPFASGLCDGNPARVYALYADLGAARIKALSAGWAGEVA